MKTETEYTDNQVGWLKTYMDSEFNAVRDAVNKVEVTTTARFEAQNEWRQQFKDQTAMFPTKDTLDAIVLANGEALKLLKDAIIDLQTFKSNVQGRFWAFAIAWPIVVAIISYIVIHFTK